jgi:spore germination cell wall hydrolase CwlJ-like protein
VLFFYISRIMASLTLQRSLRLARAYPREAAIAAGALLFSAAAMASVVHLAPTQGPLAKPIAISHAAPPPPPENAIQNVAPDKAVAINQEIPVTAAAGPAAPPFSMGGASANTRDTALTCLTQAVYYEAGQESDEGQRGVAQVVLNRVRHPAFPASVCGVVYQGSTRPTGCQFTFTCDGSLLRRPDPAGWDRARKVAAAALKGEVAASVGYATHYHANYVLPTWAGTLAKTDVIGAHLFYRWNGGWGQPGAFVQRYGGHEASAEALRSAALSAHAAYIAAGMPTAGHAAAPIAAVRAQGLPVAQANGRVTLHFTPRARAAVEAALARPHDSSPVGNVLDAGAPASDQKPLG